MRGRSAGTLSVSGKGPSRDSVISRLRCRCGSEVRTRPMGCALEKARGHRAIHDHRALCRRLIVGFGAVCSERGAGAVLDEMRELATGSLRCQLHLDENAVDRVRTLRGGKSQVARARASWMAFGVKGFKASLAGRHRAGKCQLRRRSRRDRMKPQEAVWMIHEGELRLSHAPAIFKRGDGWSEVVASTAAITPCRPMRVHWMQPWKIMSPTAGGACCGSQPKGSTHVGADDVIRRTRDSEGDRPRHSTDTDGPRRRGD